MNPNDPRAKPNNPAGVPPNPAGNQPRGPLNQPKPPFSQPPRTPVNQPIPPGNQQRTPLNQPQTPVNNPQSTTGPTRSYSNGPNFSQETNQQGENSSNQTGPFESKPKDQPSMDQLYHYTTENREHTIAYVIMAVGIILLFVNGFLGELIVGGVAGYYFAPEIMNFIQNIREFFDQQGQLRYVVLLGLLLALLIAAPGIIIAAAAVAAFKFLALNKRDFPSDYDRDIKPKL